MTTPESLLPGILDRPLDEPSSDPRAWTADTVERSDNWYFRLPDRGLGILGGYLQGMPGTITDLRLLAVDRALLADDLREVRRILMAGRGFAILEGFPLDQWDDRQLQAAYWLLGQALGVPVEQNIQGTLLYDVRDTGQDLSQGARFSVTSYESSFHTDNSFGDIILDSVGLLCLRTARSGGVNHLVSGHSVCRRLRAVHPDALAVLSRPFHFDRRGGVRQGETPTVQFPVIEESAEGLLIRYLRYWIEAGHQKGGAVLTSEQVAALDALDSVLRRPELRVEFALQRGQMLFLNNRWLLHNRTAFEDHPEPALRRHLVRLWLRGD